MLHHLYLLPHAMSPIILCFLTCTHSMFYHGEDKAEANPYAHPDPKQKRGAHGVWAACCCSAGQLCMGLGWGWGCGGVLDVHDVQDVLHGNE